jgi:sugar phosphate isomerase/epimerase
LIYDGGNFVIAEENPMELIYELAPYVQRYHVKDRVISDNLEGFVDITITGKKSQVVELSKGVSHIKEVYEILSGVYKDIPLVLEFTFGDNKIFDRVEKSAKYVFEELLV